ncbi:MAG TPA: ATP-binding protein [Actinomycetota bacterium]
MAVVVPLLAWLGKEIADDPGRFLRSDHLVWILVIGLVDLMPVQAVGGLQLTLSFPLGLAVAILYPPPVAALIAFLGAFDGREFRRETTVGKALFTRGEIAITILVESFLFHWLGSVGSPLWALVSAVGLAASVGYLVNASLVALFVRATSGRRILDVIAGMHVGSPLQYVASYLTLSGLAVLIARLYTDQGWVAVLMFVAPLALARQMFFRARDLEQLTDELRERETTLQSLSERLAIQNTTLATQAQQLEQHLEKERQAVAELRELNRLKTDFVSAASHELRNPLTSILGFARMLIRPDFSGDVEARMEFLQAIERQAVRLQAFVANLLQAAELEGGAGEPTLHRVVMQDVVAEAVQALPWGGERVEVDIAPGLPVLMSDRNVLHPILVNLLDNALKFSPPDSRCALIVRPTAEHVLIEVRDQGVGIPAESIPRIFERFRQLDSSSTRAAGGIGLGLSLVRSLVQGLGGSIEVQSEPGAGSVFRVRIPLHPAPREDEDPVPSSAV